MVILITTGENMKTLYERHVPTDEVSEYLLKNDNYNSVSLIYSEGFTEAAKDTVACQIKDTGNGFIIDLSDGCVDERIIKEINLDYAQAVNLLGILLYTHKEYKFLVTSEPEKLN